METLKNIYLKSKSKEWIEEYSKIWNDYSLENTHKNENFCVKYLNSFFHDGPNGYHFCIVYELLGITL